MDSQYVGPSAVGTHAEWTFGMVSLFASKYMRPSVAWMDDGYVGPSSVCRAFSTAWLRVDVWGSQRLRWTVNLWTLTRMCVVPSEA